MPLTIRSNTNCADSMIMNAMSVAELRMTPNTPIALNVADARYPARLRERLGEDALPELTALGNLDLLAPTQNGTLLFGPLSGQCHPHGLRPGRQVARLR